jgi:ArsR family transcriptional regulator
MLLTMATATRPNKVVPVNAARVFHALSDDTRLEIIRLLRNGEKCVCDLTEALDAAQSRLSFHLRTLKDAQLVTDRKAGRWVYYTLNEATLALAEKALARLKPGLRVLRSASDNCL